jgi:mono/diheme cytochrome c family protein
MNKGVKFVALGSGVVFVAILVVCVLMVSRGLSTRDEPTAMEVWSAGLMRTMAMPAVARKTPNPVEPSAEVLRRARAHFADHCALCHGNDGRGQTTIGRNLYPKVPDMTADTTQSLTDGEIFYVIKNGVRLTGMPAWGDDSAASDRQSWELVHLIRHLPRVTQEELSEMERMTPRSTLQREAEDAERSFLEGGESPLPSHRDR